MAVFSLNGFPALITCSEPIYRKYGLETALDDSSLPKNLTCCGFNGVATQVPTNKAKTTNLIMITTLSTYGTIFNLERKLSDIQQLPTYLY